ncbi:MAG: glutaminyl-peptide cyclotransferase, partial [Euryarchaeota archaeon]|nr:glutaminyl-peptide cyclotransferase [Euryarchaeota archaeon]
MLLILLSQMSMAEGGNNTAEERDVEILRTLPHDSSSFTQGLEVLENSIFESSGLYGHSRISEIDSQNGEIIRQTKIDDSYFGEGITVKGQSIIMLTWRAGVALEFHISNFSIIGNFSFEGEGWGICYNGEHIVTSNGSSELSFRDPDTFEIDFTTMVTWDGVPVSNLNELECVDDKIYANIWMEETILRISSTSGEVDFFSSPLVVT